MGNVRVDKGLSAALDYVPTWLELQLRLSGQAGCAVAVVSKHEVLLEQAFGFADLSTQEKLTPRHRFRVASHSKSFTAAGVMKLREQGKLKLDDPVGTYVAELNASIADVTIGQILSHSAGITRDGRDCGQYEGRRPFLSGPEVMADLSTGPVIEPNTRFKYSNHGFALLGLLIEAVTGEPYAAWLKREIIDAAGLGETTPDMPIPPDVPFARGHSTKLLLGERMIFPGDYQEDAIAPAGGVVSTASDLARFFAQLSPRASTSVLSVASRREMTRRQWRNAHASGEEFYGLGITSGTLNGWDWFGHGGGLAGYISRTAVVPDHDLTICVLTNSSNGWAGPWVEGTMHILREFLQRGAPARNVRDWAGRWWGAGGPGDHVPMGDKVVIANPLAWNPFLNATEVEVTGRDAGHVSLDNGYGNQGESVERIRDRTGRVAEIRFAGARLRSEVEVAAEMRQRYKTVSIDQEKRAAARLRRTPIEKARAKARSSHAGAASGRSGRKGP